MIDGYSRVSGLSYSRKPSGPPPKARKPAGWALEELRRHEAEKVQPKPEPKTTGEMFAEYFEAEIRRDPNDILRGDDRS